MHIYYFSGTGNSFYMAKKIAQHFNAQLEPITALQTISDDVVGFVFPSYDFKPPKIVMEKIHNATIESTYIFAVCTYGVALSKALLRLNEVLKTKNRSLQNGFGVHMPHNAIGSTGFKKQTIHYIIEQSESKLENIIQSIENKDHSIETTSLFEKGHIFKLLPQLISFLFILLKGSEKLAFKVNDRCIGCKLCQNLCPVENIKLINDKPTFKDHCTSCFACVQWCPNQAIQFGDYDFKKIHLRKYTHPSITPLELTSANRNKSHS